MPLFMKKDAFLILEKRPIMKDRNSTIAHVCLNKIFQNLSEEQIIGTISWRNNKKIQVFIFVHQIGVFFYFRLDKNQPPKAIRSITDQKIKFQIGPSTKS